MTAKLGGSLVIPSFYFLYREAFSSSNGCLCYIWPYNIAVIGLVFDIVVPDPKLGEKKKKIILMFPFFAPVVLFF